MKLEGRHAIITGASLGLGLAIADAYVAAGASILMCARGRDALEAARSRVAEKAKPGQVVLAEVVDVADPTAVDALIAAASGAFPRIDVLVNNAGIYGPIGPSWEQDWTAWREAVEVNLFGTVLACRAVVPHMIRAGYGKIVNLSGGGATAPLPRFSAYGAAKTAVVRFTETLALEVLEHGIGVNAIAPGALNTRLLDLVLAAGPERAGAAFHARALTQQRDGGSPLEQAAALAVYLGSPASDGITGRLLSAVWDPWTDLAAHQAEIAGSDVYTLRRIVPRDRGGAWG